MVKTTSLIKALKKAGYKVEVKQHKIYDHFKGEYILSSKRYYCESKTAKLGWHDQDGNAICIQSMGINQRNQAEIDYFPGYFCKTIKSALNSL